MQRFTDIKVWQRAHQFALKVYRVTADFPVEERFGLRSQMRRSVVSVPSNIAEGSKRRFPLEYAHLLNIAEGSAAELTYQFILARDLGYVSREVAQECHDELEEIGSMLNVLRQRVEAAAGRRGRGGGRP